MTNKGADNVPNDDYVGPSESTKRLMLKPTPNEQLIETIQRAIRPFEGFNIPAMEEAREIIAEKGPWWLRALLEENKRLTQEIASHGPEGRNYTNEEHIALRLELQRTREALKRIDAQRMDNEMDARRLRAELSDFKFTDKAAAEELNRLYTELAAKDKVLQWYADEDNHYGESHCHDCFADRREKDKSSVEIDYGYQARKVIKSYPPREKGAEQE